MVHNLFEELVVDLDARRIVDFKLKPWADRFLVLRMVLQEEEHPELAEKVRAELAQNETPPTAQGQGNDMPHRGFEGQKRSCAGDTLGGRAYPRAALHFPHAA